ncbi:FMN-binding protein [Alkaliphilus peptidifermentans]|uniref:FMN-binding domain-containing protein n=1 Tax=Alkaliphilus peptidifermentans DSM 18978 TaxID=1120976 RepID=A0A1G5JT23_9FIRM|nr:FMN-binding protein [Alkaliphilus peptidifermentans]SCY90809.1 FMN-binding domain-containing protein [Alkaliphilus peptidifermentans DSM 18978]
MKKVLKILGVIFLTLVVAMIAVVFIVKSLDLPKEMAEINVNNVNLAGICEGVYSGSYDAGLVKVAVVLQVKDNKIVDITIEEHQNGLGGKAEKIVDSIIEEQTLDVEIISGATISSNAIRKAIENALTQN